MNATTKSVLRLGNDITIDLLAGEVKKGSEVHPLTRNEWKLLSYLAKNKGRIVKNENLRSCLWPAPHMDRNKELYAYIGQLRKKLENFPNQPQYLISVRGKGYLLKG